MCHHDVINIVVRPLNPIVKCLQFPGCLGISDCFDPGHILLPPSRIGFLSRGQYSSVTTGVTINDVSIFLDVVDGVTMICRRFNDEEIEMSIPLVRKFVSVSWIWTLMSPLLIQNVSNPAVEAHGNHPRSELVLESTTAAYHLQVYAIPWVGDAHFSANIANSGTKRPVADAKVTVTLLGGDNEDVAHVAGPVYGSPGWYTATVIIEHAGSVTAVISVTGPDGEINERFGLDVKPPETGTSWGMIGLLAVSMVLILRIFLVRIFRGKRHSNPVVEGEVDV